MRAQKILLYIMLFLCSFTHLALAQYEEPSDGGLTKVIVSERITQDPAIIIIAIILLLLAAAFRFPLVTAVFMAGGYFFVNLFLPGIGLIGQLILGAVLVYFIISSETQL